MNILLTHGYFLEEDPKEKVIMKPYPPLGILGIAAFLREEGYEPQIFDSTFSTFDHLVARLLENPPDLLGIYTNLMTRPRVIDIIRAIRNHPLLRHITIILGGPEITAHADRFLNEGADIVAIGEGEMTMLEVTRAIESKCDLDDVTGIMYRRTEPDGKMSIRHNAPRELMKRLDALPMPARDGIDLGLYLDAWKTRHGRNAISVSTMRGCPYTCRWCSRAVYGNSYRRRPASRVVDEMEYLATTYQPDSLWFVDDVFTISPKWLQAFTEEVETRNVRIPYECITRADRLDEGMIDLLVRSGCYRVWIGAESGSQRIIDAMDRRVDVEQVRRMMQLSRAAGLETGTFIMLGYPGETEEDILETIRHLKACAPDHFTVTTTYPITGTPLFHEVESMLEERPEWSRSTDRDLSFPRTYHDAFYHHALRRLYSEVALNRLRLDGGGAITKGKELAKILLSSIGMAFWKRAGGMKETGGKRNGPPVRNEPTSRAV